MGVPPEGETRGAVRRLPPEEPVTDRPAIGCHVEGDLALPDVGSRRGDEGEHGSIRDARRHAGSLDPDPDFMAGAEQVGHGGRRDGHGRGLGWR